LQEAKSHREKELKTAEEEVKKSKKKAEKSTKNMKAKQQVFSFAFITEIFITVEMVREARFNAKRWVTLATESVDCVTTAPSKKNRRDAALSDFLFSERAAVTQVTERDDSE